MHAVRAALELLRDPALDALISGESPFDDLPRGMSELSRDGSARLPPLVDHAGYRVAQEALANVRRHSDARHAVVTLGMVNDEVLVEIEDDGRGFGPETSYGMGLTGMRERVLVLGGELEVEGREGVGTRVFLRVRLGVLTGGETGERSNA